MTDQMGYSTGLRFGKFGGHISGAILVCRSATCVWDQSSWHRWAATAFYCMCGVAWSSRWLMTQLTNGERACMLVFVLVATFWTYFVTINLFSLYLMNFMFHIMLDAACNILRVHYKSMKCDVSFSLCSVSTLFRWGGHLCYLCVKSFFLLTTVRKL